jgi:large subunit ribosomal protein L24
MARHIRTGDRVKVLAGESRGLTGKVLRIVNAKEHSDHQKVIVEGANIRRKHVAKTQANPQGGMIDVEMPIHISNVMPLDDDGKATRVRFETRDDGSKHRVAATTGKSIGAPLKKPRS